MNKQRIAILIVAGLGVLAACMPWYEDEYYTRWDLKNFEDCASFFCLLLLNMNKFANLSIVLFAVPLVISLLNDRKKALKGGLLYSAIFPGLIAGGIGIWHLWHLWRWIGVGYISSDCVGNGLYLVVLVGIALPIVAFVVKEKEFKPQIITNLVINPINIIVAGKSLKRVVYVVAIMIVCIVIGWIVTSGLKNMDTIKNTYMILGLVGLVCNVIILIQIYSAGDNLENSVSNNNQTIKK